MFGKQFSWLLKMAWRDSRRSRSRLFLFVSSIILGVAALVAIQTFSENLQYDINSQAKTMIGADLMLESNRPFTPEILDLMDSLGGDQSREISFASMVYFPETEGTRLVQIRALEGKFPYYGKIETSPSSAGDNFLGSKLALADQAVILRAGMVRRRVRRHVRLPDVEARACHPRGSIQLCRAMPPSTAMDSPVT
jgi:putative ABC transport system permease protein